jgi:hypothetical protein
MNILQDLVIKELEYTQARQKLFNGFIDRVSLIQEGLHNPEQRGTCLRLIEYLHHEEREKLFNDLLELSSVAHSDLELCYQVILSFPDDWLLENIEERAEQLLIDATYEEYRCLLELYSKIDHNLTQRLASRAIQQDNLDIIEAGEDFQKTINFSTQEIAFNRIQEILTDPLLDALLINKRSNSPNRAPLYKIMGVSKRIRKMFQRSEVNKHS